ncbi:hypothetical protein T492DRAFT_847936 [Pavlovales sp. CCMP2436]|nr:hypothetical protein T492DRAFT_847936 [Pavlovales sp. CCMP2436]
MIDYDQKSHWLVLVFQLRGSLFPSLYREIIAAAIVGYLAALAQTRGVTIAAMGPHASSFHSTPGILMDDKVPSLQPQRLSPSPSPRPATRWVQHTRLLRAARCPSRTRDGWFTPVALVHTILIFPLGFLLIFRSNNAYGRYMEGRMQLGKLVESVREITRTIAAYHSGEGAEEKAARTEMRRLTNVLL